MHDGPQSMRSTTDGRDAEPDGPATDADVRAAPAGLAPGTVVAGNFRIVRALGRGAMGVVYEAMDEQLERRVAIKLHRLGRAAPADAARMWQEAKAMARLSHPNVVTVYEVALHEGALCIAMELVAGSDARAWAQAQPRSTAEILGVYLQACRGLAAAHELGIVHRDFKPDNVLVGADGRVRVADFGIARLHAHDSSAPTDSLESSSNIELAHTKTGALLGTPAYMAPEQLAGAVASAAADQFACCASIWEALYGARPFTCDSVAARFLAIQEQHYEAHASRRAVPGHVVAALQRGLASDPAQRWPSIVALADALADDPARRRRRVALGAAVVLAIGGSVWLSRRADDRCAALADGAGAVWQPQREAELAAQFTRADSPLAASAAAAVQRVMGPWAQTWARARVDACRATWDRGEQSPARLDAQMDCLARQQVDVEAMLAVLDVADAEAIAHVQDMLAHVPDPATCADVDASGAGDTVDAGARERYAISYAAIAAAQAECAADHLQRCSDLAQQELATLSEQRWRWLETRAQLLRGRALDELGFDLDAQDALQQATISSFATTDGLLQLRSMSSLAGILGTKTRGTHEALRWIDAATAIATRVEATTDDRLELARARVVVLAIAARFAEAEAVARQALAEQPPESLVHARILRHLSAAVRDQLRADEALGLIEDALAMAQRVLGPDSPWLLEFLDGESVTLRAVGRLDDALAVADQAVALAERVFGPDAPSTGHAHRIRADALQGLGRLSEAVAAYDRALAIARAREDDADVIFASVNLSAVYGSMGEEPRALALLQDAVRRADALFGPDSLRAGQVRTGLSGLLIGTGQYAEAVPVARTAIELYERHLGPADPELARPLGNLALALALTGHGDEALALADRLRSVQAGDGVTDRTRAQGFQIRAEVFSLLGRADEAIAARRAAVERWQAYFGKPHTETLDGVYHLADELVDAGRMPEAAEAAEQALALLEVVQTRPRRRAALEWILARALWADPPQRARALALARSAAAGFEALGDSDAPAVAAWIAEHDG